MSEPERGTPSLNIPLERKVMNIIAWRMSVAEETIKETFTITGDLRADSLDVAEMAMDLEDAFGLRNVWDEEPSRFDSSTTVGDVIAYVQKKINDKDKPKLDIPHGVAPTSPVDGDQWETPEGPFIQVKGVTIPMNVLKMLEHTKAEVAKGLQSPSQVLAESKTEYDAVKIKAVALDLAGEFWWEEGIKQLKARGLNHHSGNETIDRATNRAMLSHVYDLFHTKPSINEITDAEILLELFKRKHLFERLKTEVFNRSE